VADGIDFDFSEFLKLAADLDSAPARIAPKVRKAVQFTATEVKKAGRKRANRTGLAGYAASIDYDMKVGVGTIGAEIGPNLGKKQGSFGLVEDATGSVRSAPQHAIRDALRANEADFIKGLTIAISDDVL